MDIEWQNDLKTFTKPNQLSDYWWGPPSPKHVYVVATYGGFCFGHLQPIIRLSIKQSILTKMSRKPKNFRICFVDLNSSVRCDFACTCIDHDWLSKVTLLEGCTFKLILWQLFLDYAWKQSKYSKVKHER